MWHLVLWLMSQQRVVSTYFLRGFMEPRWHDLWTPLYIVSAEHQPLLDPLITLQHVTKKDKETVQKYKGKCNLHWNKQTNLNLNSSNMKSKYCQKKIDILFHFFRSSGSGVGGGWYKCGCLPGKWADLSVWRGDIGRSALWISFRNTIHENTFFDEIK